MATTRKTHKKKVYHYDEDGTKNPEIWIEVERLDKLIVETGRGFHYQKTIYTFKWEDEKDDGTWATSEGRTTVKRIKNPDNETQWVELPVIDKVIVETGRGFSYQKTIHRFDNTDANNSRKTHTKTVYYTNGKTQPPDKSQKLDVEVIEKLTREFGRGFAYRKTVAVYNDQGDEGQ